MFHSSGGMGLPYASPCIRSLRKKKKKSAFGYFYYLDTLFTELTWAPCQLCKQSSLAPGLLVLVLQRALTQCGQGLQLVLPIQLAEKSKSALLVDLLSLLKPIFFFSFFFSSMHPVISLTCSAESGVFGTAAV